MIALWNKFHALAAKFGLPLPEEPLCRNRFRRISYEVWCCDCATARSSKSQRQLRADQPPGESG
jgi:hypothetical protein